MQLSRRDLMMSGVALGLGASFARSSGAAVERPNILWLVSEDNNPFIGAYGDKLAHTPAIDALAAKGLLYQNAFSTAPVCAPSRYALITGAPAEGNAPANHMRALAKLPTGWRTTPEFMRAAGYYCTNNSKTDYNCDIDGAKVWNESSNTAHYRDRPAGKPFFSVFNFMTTHESMLFKMTPGRLKPEDVTVPAELPDTPAIRNDIASYYNLMEKMDGQVAQHLADLQSAGLAEDTIVFYYSDNGGVLPTTKRNASDRGLRVGLVAYYPPKWSHLAPGGPGSVVTSPVTLMDLPPTILWLAGQPVPKQMEGRPLVKGAAHSRYAFGMRNRMDERYDFVRSVTDGRWRYTRNYMPYLPAGQYGAFEWIAKGYQSLDTEYRAGRLTQAQARFFEPRLFEELYDIKSDPRELTNRATHADAKSKLQELRAVMDANMLRTHDNGFIPEGSVLEGYDASRRKGAYPLKQLMRLGAQAASRDPAHLATFRAGLGDPNEVVRYWSAMGLLMLGEKAGGAEADILQRYKNEPSPQVRVALAEALGYLGAKDEASSLLREALEREPSAFVKLQAVNALTHIGASDSATIAAMVEAQKVDDEYISRAAKYHELLFTGRYQPDFPIFGGTGGSWGAPSGPR